MENVNQQMPTALPPARRFNKNIVIIAVTLLVVLACLAGLLYYMGMFGKVALPQIGGLSNDEIAQRAVEHINTNQLAGPGNVAKLISVSEDTEHNLVKIQLDIAGNNFDSYATHDGKLLFPTAEDMSVAK